MRILRHLSLERYSALDPKVFPTWREPRNDVHNVNRNRAEIRVEMLRRRVAAEACGSGRQRVVSGGGGGGGGRSGVDGGGGGRQHNPRTQ